MKIIIENIKINVNDHVKIKLTNIGQEILKAYYGNSLSILYPSFEDEWISIPIWKLMRIFGPNMYMGNNDLPFKTDFIIERMQFNENVED